MQVKIFSLTIGLNDRGEFQCCSADKGLLSVLDYTAEELRLTTPATLGLSARQLELLTQGQDESRSEISTQALNLRCKSGQIFTVTAFRSNEGSQETLEMPVAEALSSETLVSEMQDEKIVLHLVDVSSFVPVVFALRQSEENYRELVENANSIILRWDHQGRITFFNEYAQEFFGYSEEEIIGQHLMDTIVPRTESTGRDLSSLLDDVCLHPENYESNINENCTKSGKRVWVNWTNKVLWNDKGQLLGLSIGSDITKLKQMETELSHKHKMDAIGQLAGGMAHDFNNMLQGLMGFAEILHGKLENEKLKGYARQIINIARQSSELTRQFLAFARKGQYQLVAIDLHRTVTEVVVMLKHSLDRKITIEKSLQAINYYTAGDPSQIKNALLNLALNAKDAMPEGGRLSFITSNVLMEDANIQAHKLDIAPGDYIKLDVIDTGQGMTEEVKEHLFEPFYTTKNWGEGTGMGLAAVYGILNNHQGGIVVESQAGKGSCLSLYFPVSQNQPNTIAEKTDRHTGKGNILLVDDEEIIRTYSKILFEQHDYQVHTCKDGLEAIEYYRKEGHKIDLVILDMIMPKMGGRETFYQLKAMDPEVKVLLASGYGLDEEVQTLLDEGVIDFIQKPFTLEHLSPIMKQVLD